MGPQGGWVPGRRSILQSYGWWIGKLSASFLSKTSWKLAYFFGSTGDRLIGGLGLGTDGDGSVGGESEGELELGIVSDARLHCAWARKVSIKPGFSGGLSRKVMVLVCQLM